MVGFPHSEIIGSKLIRSSPTLIAAYYVLHRLCTPRHPLDALKTLDRSHYQCPQFQQHQPLLKADVSIIGIVDPPHHCSGFDRSDQINQISRVPAVPPRGCRVKRNNNTSLYDVERSGLFVTEVAQNPNFVSLTHTAFAYRGSRQSPLNRSKRMVEPDGIEPTTSCLQSRRSPS